MIITDILQVIYAPQKAFKKIIENPKYLGAIIILILFIAFQMGYEYSQISKTEIEQTSPQIGLYPAFTNATMWSSATNSTLSNNGNDFFNYTIYEAGYGYIPAIFGNSSLQIQSSNNSIQSTLDIVKALTDVNNTLVTRQQIPLSSLTVDCGGDGFHNLTLIIKQTQPQIVPTNAILTLHSGNDNFQYDLTSALSNASNIGQYVNITIPVGVNATGWTQSANPQWNTVSSLTLEATYPAGSNAALNIGAVFFRGQYQTLLDINSTGFLLNFLQQFSLQFLFTWFLMTALIYVFFRGFKQPMTWKPIFIAMGFAMVVMVIRSIVNIIATLTLPAIYYPFDVWPGLSLTPYGVIFYPTQMAGTLFADSQAAVTSTAALASTFASITVTMFFVSYVWLAIMAVIVVGTLKPEFSLIKRISIAAVSVAVTLLALLLLSVGA